MGTTAVKRLTEGGGSRVIPCKCINLYWPDLTKPRPDHRDGLCPQKHKNSHSCTQRRSDFRQVHTLCLSQLSSALSHWLLHFVCLTGFSSKIIGAPCCSESHVNRLKKLPLLTHLFVLLAVIEQAHSSRPFLPLKVMVVRGVFNKRTIMWALWGQEGQRNHFP